MKRHPNLVVSILSLGAACFATTAAGQQSLAPIDRDLVGQIDFRSPDYAVCLEQTTCAVGPLTLSAFREDTSGQTVPANIYWDPVDGVGVMDGGQNDEIDFDERLVVKFDRAATVSSVWISDLFAKEVDHYGGQAAAGANAEIAQIDLINGGASRNQLIVNAETALPPRVFNTAVAPSVFSKSGDLLLRVVVRDDLVSVVSASGSVKAGTMAGDEGLIEADKQDLFAGLPTIQIDTARLLSLIDGVVLFPAGEVNADRVAGLVRQGSSFDAMYQASAALRATSDVSNGEVAAYLEAPVSVDEMVFTAPFSTSNEFSVSGIVLRK